MTQQQWPTLPQPSGPDAAEGDQDEASYALIVEQNTGSADGMRWLATAPVRLRCTRAEARARARELAGEFTPNHPMMEQARSVFRLSADEYLVVVEGATMGFHFRITVAEPV